MQRFFESVIEPIFEKENIRTMVEIGADRGLNTAKLIQYANRFGGKVYSIDPLPGFDSEEWERENPDTFTMCRDLSLNVIKTIKDAQCFLIDGDHNWYTVYNELCQIYEAYGEDNFPLVMFHDILWPYDRRDLYYSPETIPAIYRHDYEKKAMKPSTKSLVSDGINGNLFNAKKYGGEKNGVLTAIEDFVNDHPTLNLDIYTIDVLHGLGMIASKEKYPEAVNHFYSLSALKGAMQLCENERLDKAVKINVLTKKIQQLLDAEKKASAKIFQVGKVYPNFGEGYSEETAFITGKYNPDNDSYYAGFTFEKAPEFIRFDPVGGCSCILENISLYDGDGIIEPYSANGTALTGGYVFTNRDPQIIYKNIHRSKRFEIRADIFPFKSVAAIKLISDVLDKNRCLEGEKCQLESENNALSEEKRRLNDQVMDKNREIERLNSSLKKSEKDLSLLKSSSAEQIKLANDKIAEISRKNTALTDANNSLEIGNRLLKRLLNLNKAVGWRYALKSLFSRGISATRANIKALKLIRKQGSFDMIYYCERYKDVLERGIDPLIHFIWFGGYENRNPYKGFDVAWYLKNYSDVRKSKVNPYAHYVLWGKGEKRKTAGNVK